MSPEKSGLAYHPPKTMPSGAVRPAGVETSIVEPKSWVLLSTN